MRWWCLLVLPLALCACQEPLYKQYVPTYPTPQSGTEAESVIDADLESALENYTADGTTGALQDYLLDHPDDASGRAAAQILVLDRRLADQQRELEQQSRSLRECRQQNQQAEQQAAHLKQQLEALAESLIKQEKRLP